MVTPYKQAYIVTLKSGRVVLAVVEAESRVDGQEAAKATAMGAIPGGEFWSIAAYPTSSDLKLGAHVLGALNDFAEPEPAVEPEPVPHVYEFSLRISATVCVTATSESEAIALLENATMESANLGMLSNGDPILATLDEVIDGSGGDWKAFKIDGKEV